MRWPSGLLASRTDVHTTACSAKVTYVVGIPTDPIHWQPLAVGFAQRYATKAQRAALAVRDGSGCVYPGCTVPAHRCIAHHIRPWDDRGPTDLTNLVLDLPFSPPHSPPRETRHHPNPHRPLHSHPPPTGHHPLAARDRAERPGPTDPKNRMKPPVTGVRPAPKEAAHPRHRGMPADPHQTQPGAELVLGPRQRPRSYPKLGAYACSTTTTVSVTIQRGLVLQVTESVVGEVHQVCHYFVLAGLADIEPPLSSESDHPDQHLRVHRASLVL